MRKPEMIVFDCGQTLINESAFDGIRGTEAVLKYAEENRYHLSAREVWAEKEKINEELGIYMPQGDPLVPVEMPNHTVTAYLYESLGIRISLAAEQIDRIFWDAAAPGIPTDGIEEFLKFLYGFGIRTGVISNICYAGKVLEDKINELFADHHFEFIIASSEYLFRKPCARIFKLGLEKAQLAADRVWYIGDNFDCDVTGARSAGMFPVLYTGASESCRDDNTDGVMRIKNWKELQSILEGTKEKAEDAL